MAGHPGAASRELTSPLRVGPFEFRVGTEPLEAEDSPMTSSTRVASPVSWLSAALSRLVWQTTLSAQTARPAASRTGMATATTPRSMS